MEMMKKLEDYLKERFGPETRLRDMEPLGEGVHGRAFLIRFSTPQKEEHLIMKALFPPGSVMTITRTGRKSCFWPMRTTMKCLNT